MTELEERILISSQSPNQQPERSEEDASEGHDAESEAAAVEVQGEDGSRGGRMSRFGPARSFFSSA